MLVSADATIIRDPEGGTNQSGLRDQNARVVLSFIRRHGAMPSAEIARRSGLSAQTVSNIIRALEADGLLTRGEAIKGKVGKPSVPMTLNPGGVFSLGLNIGRRSAELVLVDFNGARVAARSTAYDYPSIENVFQFLASGLAEIYEERPAAETLVAGIGVSRPNRIWDWLELVDAPADAMRKWKGLDLKAAVGKTTGLDVIEENDATSACVSEQLLGRGNRYTDFAYIFVGAFVGGGLVLNGKVRSGPHHNTAALGQLPVPDGAGGTQQLLNVASLHRLETALRDAGRDPARLRRPSDAWSDIEDLVGPWIEETGNNLAIAAAAITSVVEVEAVLIEGAMPEPVRARLTRHMQAAFLALDITGIENAQIEEATVGRRARSLGAALLPIHALYFLA